jgi:hypothetical protein
MDRLTFAVRYRRIRPSTVDLLIRSLQREAAKYRPSTLTRIGAFVLRQVMGQGQERRQRSPAVPRAMRRGGTVAQRRGG